MIKESKHIPELIKKINIFLEGDNTKKNVFEIEGILSMTFKESDEILDIIETLALYEPGGLNPYTNEKEVSIELKKILHLLDGLS